MVKSGQSLSFSSLIRFFRWSSGVSLSFCFAQKKFQKIDLFLFGKYYLLYISTKMSVLMLSGSIRFGIRTVLIGVLLPVPMSKKSLMYLFFFCIPFGSGHCFFFDWWSDFCMSFFMFCFNRSKHCRKLEILSPSTPFLTRFGFCIVFGHFLSVWLPFRCVRWFSVNW